MCATRPQTDRQTYIHTDRQMYIQTDRHTYIHTDRQMYIQTDRHTYIHTYRQMYTQTDIHTDRQMYIQTDRHTYIHTYRQTETDNARRMSCSNVSYRDNRLLRVVMYWYITADTYTHYGHFVGEPELARRPDFLSSFVLNLCIPLGQIKTFHILPDSTPPSFPQSLLCPAVSPSIVMQCLTQLALLMFNMSKPSQFTLVNHQTNWFQSLQFSELSIFLLSFTVNSDIHLITHS